MPMLFKIMFKWIYVAGEIQIILIESVKTTSMLNERVLKSMWKKNKAPFGTWE